MSSTFQTATELVQISICIYEAQIQIVFCTAIMPVYKPWADELADLRKRRTLFLSGGGFKTLGFAGVLEQLGWHHFERYVGLSAGAIFAFMLALGDRPVKILGDFRDKVPSVLCDCFSMQSALNHGAPMQSSLVRVIFEDALETKGLQKHITFRALKEELRVSFEVVVFCMRSCRLKLLSDQTEPDVQVVDALMASIAIPVLFEPVAIGHCGTQCCDAGIINNTPLGLVPPMDTIALIVRPEPATGAITFPQTAFLRCAFASRASLMLAQKAGLRVIQVPVPDLEVSLLSPGSSSSEAFLAAGRCALAFYVLRYELTGLLVVALSCCRFFFCTRQEQRRAKIAKEPSHFSTNLRACLCVFGTNPHGAERPPSQ